MEQTSATAIGGRHDAALDMEEPTRARWRIAERVISVAIGGAAISGAIYLGVTGPLISPVTPPAAGAASTTADDDTATDDAAAEGPVLGDGRGAGGDHAGGGRHR